MSLENELNILKVLKVLQRQLEIHTKDILQLIQTTKFLDKRLNAIENNHDTENTLDYIDRQFKKRQLN